MLDKTMIESLKELARVMVLAMIPIAIESLMANQINYRLIAFTGVIAGLRALDKLLHEWGKEKELEGTKKKPVKSKMVGGITRF